MARKVGRPPGINYPVNVTVRFTTEQVAAIEKAAEQSEKKRGLLLREIVESWLQQRELL